MNHQCSFEIASEHHRVVSLEFWHKILQSHLAREVVWIGYTTGCTHGDEPGAEEGGMKSSCDQMADWKVTLRSQPATEDEGMVKYSIRKSG